MIIVIYLWVIDMNLIKIDIGEKFTKKIGLKSTARLLFAEFDDVDEVILDFKNIEFISRSFAQEYVYQRYHSKAKITEINMSEFIEGLLKVVEEDFRETCLS